MILTLPDRAERRRIAKKMHKTKDKDHCRRLNAILLLSQGYSVSAVSKLWHALHETVTRDHQCKEMWQLLKRVRNFMDNVSPFPGGSDGLQKVKHN